jgi:hypothetical protein
MRVVGYLARTVGFALAYLIATGLGRAAVPDGTTVSMAWPAAGVAALWFLAQRRGPRAADRVLRVHRAAARMHHVIDGLLDYTNARDTALHRIGLGHLQTHRGETRRLHLRDGQPPGVRNQPGLHLAGSPSVRALCVRRAGVRLGLRLDCLRYGPRSWAQSNRGTC